MKKLIFSVFAIFMVLMFAGCGLKGQLYFLMATNWSYIGNEDGAKFAFNLHFEEDVCDGFIEYYMDGYTDYIETIHLTQRPYIVDGDQLTLDLNVENENIPVLVGTYTAEVKGKKLILTDKDGESITFIKGVQHLQI